MVTNSEKNDKSLAEFMVIIILIGIFMSVFITYFMKQESQFSDTGFKSLSQKFTSKVSTVHAQWLMDKQPRVVRLSALNQSEKQLVTVNRKGWVDVAGSDFVCERIWQLVMESPLNLMKQTISAIEVRTLVNNTPQKTESVCRYVLPSNSYFEYNRVNGRVSAVVASDTVE
jgi:competence protein ComGC